MYMNASVSANMKMSGQKPLYKMLMVSFRRPQAVKGESLRIQDPARVTFTELKINMTRFSVSRATSNSEAEAAAVSSPGCISYSIIDLELARQAFGTIAKSFCRH